jgi:hypothetical protein
MSYDHKLGKNDVTEYHIGFDCNYDDIHEFYPNTIEALDMLDALGERDFDVDHSKTWKLFHSEGIFQDVENYVKQQLMLK